jgi:hypothetical protein
MKAIFHSALPALLTLSILPAFGQTTGQVVYMRSSVSQPWGQNTNENAMDTVFGSGEWTTVYYEAVDTVAAANALLSSANSFIFMEGGDSSYDPFATFLNTYGVQLTTWISNGGRLLIMSAPNNPLVGTLLYLPGNIALKSDEFYGSAATSGYAVDISNPIFRGRFGITGYYFTGDFFSHGYFTGQQLQPIMLNNLSEIVLGQYQYGTGLMVYGGMTTDNFQQGSQQTDPSQPHMLLENIIDYTANISVS